MKRRITWSLVAAFIVSQAPAQAATLGGLVLDERTGEAVSAYLSLEKEQKCGSGYIYVSKNSVATDENGAFTLTGLEAGNYQLVVNNTAQNDYVPEAYDNLSPYAPNGRTSITLGADEERNDIVIELAKRPFHIEGVSWEPADFLEKGGRGKAILTVMNSTAKSKRMRFWLTFDMQRQEGNLFDNTDSLVPADMHREGLHTVTPGTNTVDLEVNLPEGIGERAHLDYTITAGLNRWQPLMPAWRTMPAMRLMFQAYPICWQMPPIVLPPPVLSIPAVNQEGTTTWGSASTWSIQASPLSGAGKAAQE